VCRARALESSLSAARLPCHWATHQGTGGVIFDNGSDAIFDFNQQYVACECHAFTKRSLTKRQWWVSTKDAPADGLDHQEHDGRDDEGYVYTYEI